MVLLMRAKDAWCVPGGRSVRLPDILHRPKAADTVENERAGGTRLANLTGLMMAVSGRPDTASGFAGHHKGADL